MDHYVKLRCQADRRRGGPIPDWTGGRHGDRAPGSPRLPNRNGQPADHAGGSRASVALWSSPGAAIVLAAVALMTG